MRTRLKPFLRFLGSTVQRNRLPSLGWPVFLLLALGWAGCATTPAPSKEKSYDHFTAGAYYEDQGKPGEAIKEYQEALRYDPDAVELWTTLAETYYNNNQFRESGEAARQALRRDSLALEARIMLANSDLAQKRVPEALAEYEHAARLGPERWDILYTLSNLYELRGDFRNAAEKLGRILALRPEAVDIKSRMGGLLVKSGALDKAEEVYAGLVAEDSTSLDGHLGLGFVYELKHEFVPASVEYEAALALHPGSPSIMRRLLNVYQNAGEETKALAMCREVLAKDSTDLQARLSLGLFLYNGKRYEESRSAFHKVIEKRPRDAMAHYYLGRIANEQKDYPLARAELEAALRSEPNLTGAWILLGTLEIRAGEEKKAIQAFKQAVGPGPQAAGGLDYLLGYAYAEVDSHARAVTAYRQALALNPKDSRVYYGIGVSYDKLGNTDSSIAAFRKVIALDSTDASAYNYIGYLYADRGIHLEEALGLIRKALAIEPENGFFIDSIAWAYYKLGRYEEAEREQEKACRIVQDDPALREHLGDIYQARGKVPEAHAQWQRALELDPKNEGLKKKLHGGP
jgi:tetratricopeptide (TPR) repeat protein